MLLCCVLLCAVVCCCLLCHALCCDLLLRPAVLLYRVECSIAKLVRTQRAEPVHTRGTTQALIGAEGSGIGSVEELPSWFAAQVASIVGRQGVKTMQAWQVPLHGPLLKSVKDRCTCIARSNVFLDIILPLL